MKIIDGLRCYGMLPRGAARKPPHSKTPHEPTLVLNNLQTLSGRAASKSRLSGRIPRAALVLALLGFALASSASTGDGAGGQLIGNARHGGSASIGALCLGESKVGLKSPPAGKTPEQGSTGKSEPPAAAPSKEAPPAEVSSGTDDKDNRDIRRERRLQKRREELKRKADEAAKAQQDKAVTAPPGDAAQKDVLTKDGKQAGDATAQTPEKSPQAQSSDASPKNTPPKSPQRHRFMWQARP